jgi:hypothetical protein
MSSNSRTDTRAHLNSGSTRSVFVKLFFIVALVYAPACSNNYLETFATKTDNDSLFWAAQSALWNNDYATAIASCNNLSSDYISLDNVAIVCASAYAGRCGYSLTWMTTNLPTISPPIYLAELQLFNTASTAQQVSDCETAETILQGIGTAAQRSADANMFMALLTIYKNGVISSNMASNGAGAVTAGFDPCNLTFMSAANQQAVGMAFYDLYMSVQQLSSVQLISSVMTAVAAECTALQGLGQDVCNLGGATVGTSAGDFNPLNLSPTALKGASSIIKEGFAFGLNVGCGGASVITCNCP